MIWWHRHVLKHEVSVHRVSVPWFDMSARGLLFKCWCGKRWAK